MTCLEKIEELRAEIRRQLEPLLGGRKCLYLDAPYHHNIGDVCIWDGARNFLHEIGATITATHSVFWKPGQKIDRETVIVLHGGGNFGDLYRGCQDFRLKVIAQYPDNRIVMLPQSVWYKEASLIANDAAQMAPHKDLWLCARDNAAYRFMTTHFGANNVLKVPDMAFYMDDLLLEGHRKTEPTGRHLFMRRTDDEITESTPQNIGEQIEVHDWPTFEGKYHYRMMFLQLSNHVQKYLSRAYRPAGLPFLCLVDYAADNIMRPALVNLGLKFLSQYDTITTTRLHAVILGTLLCKQINYIDNKTGKLTDYVSTWLSGLDSINRFKN